MLDTSKILQANSTQKNKLKFTPDHVEGITVQRTNVTNTSHQQNETLSKYSEVQISRYKILFMHISTITVLISTRATQKRYLFVIALLSEKCSTTLRTVPYRYGILLEILGIDLKI